MCELYLFICIFDLDLWYVYSNMYSLVKIGVKEVWQKTNEIKYITKTICLVGSVHQSRIYKVRESTHCKGISYHNTETSVCFCYHCHWIKSFVFLCSGEEFVANFQVFSAYHSLWLTQSSTLHTFQCLNGYSQVKDIEKDCKL